MTGTRRDMETFEPGLQDLPCSHLEGAKEFSLELILTERWVFTNQLLMIKREYLRQQF